MSELELLKQAAFIPGSKSYLFYGPPGTGKTWLSLLHPGKKKLVLDIDDKIREIENSEKLLAGTEVWTHNELIVPKGIVFQEVDPQRKDPKRGFIPGEAPRGYKRQVAVTNELIELGRKCKETGQPFYDCIIWDSGTRTVDHLIQAILYQHQMGSMTETLWGVFGQNFLQYLSGFLRLRDYGADCIAIFHERHVVKRNKEQEIIEEYIRPSVYGAQGINLGQQFSEMYYFLGRTPDGKYRIQTINDGVIPARTTKNLDSRQIIDPLKIFAT